MINFNQRALLIKKGSKFVVFHRNFEPPPFYATILRKNEIRMPGTQGKKGGSKFQGPRASGPPSRAVASTQTKLVSYPFSSGHVVSLVVAFVARLCVLLSLTLDGRNMSQL